MNSNNDGVVGLDYSARIVFALVWIVSKTNARTLIRVLSKMRNDLKQPTMSKKWPEMTYNKQEMTWIDPQQVRHNLQWPYLQRAKKRCEMTNSKQIFRLFYNMRQKVLFINRFSTQHLVAVIRALLHRESWWKQRQASIIMHQASIIMCIFYGIYKIYFFSVWVSC